MRSHPFEWGRIARRVRSGWDRPRSRGVILVYHRITEPGLDPWDLRVSPSHFEEHLTVVSKHWRTVQQRDVATARLGRRTQPFVALTLDDGYRDNLTVARPLLERHDVPATAFLVTDALTSNRPFWWDELATIVLDGKDLPNDLDITLGSARIRWQPANSGTEGDDLRQIHDELWANLRRLPRSAREEALDKLAAWSGRERAQNCHDHVRAHEANRLADDELIEAGAHTQSHPWLPGLEPLAAREEILGGKKELEAVIGRRVDSFAYPFGDPGQASEAIVAESGFTSASIGASRVVTGRTNPFRLPRLHVTDCDGDELLRRLERLGMRTERGKE